VSGKFIYLDTSAFVKLVVADSESSALSQYLRRRPNQASAALIRTEALRAARRLDPSLTAAVRQRLRYLTLIRLSSDLLDRAGELDPLTMRSLDAIHLAAALSLGSDLGSFVTYDETLGSAAAHAGLRVVSPT
jgi:predicted nucleic acid-binding protein